MAVSGFNFYNECNVDYYMVAIGSNTQDPTGLANLGVNLAFRTFKGEDTTLIDLGTAVSAYALSATDGNAETLGKAAGTLIRTILEVEIPTATEVDPAYYQPASSFGSRRRR